jgi:arylsulfatase
MAISWPGHITDVGGIRTQFHHIIDIVPTILAATGIQAPVMVDGVAQKPIEGVSMAYTYSSRIGRSQMASLRGRHLVAHRRLVG